MTSLLRAPAQAIAWANGQTKWAPHSCLNFVKNAYYGDNPTQNSLDGKPYLHDALDGWRNSEHKHTDRNPPVGALMYFDGVNASDPGDVQIVTAPGLTRRTDVGAWGRVATTDIWWMERTVGRKYRGWTGDILGLPWFDGPTPTTPSAPPFDTITPPTSGKRKHMDIIETNGDIWVVDHAARTKWNVITGLKTVPQAMSRVQWLRNQGYKYYAKQPPAMLNGYKTI